MRKPKETDLYPPIKALLQSQGYVVKGEVGTADVVACRGDEDPVIVELKTGFSLSLFHQGIDRQAITELVYIAVPRGKGKPFLNALKNNTGLCRRLGLGLITVRLEDGFSEVHLDPGPYRPRQSKKRKTRLLRAFSRLVGDPNAGGATRVGIVTAYRHDALRCLHHIADHGPSKASVVAASSGIPKARDLMANNHYGWFERVSVGIYGLSPKGQQAQTEFADTLREIAKGYSEK